ADLITPLQQTLLHHGQQHIAEPLVEGAILREDYLLAGASFDLIGQLGRIAGDLLRLQSGGLHLIANQRNRSRQAQQKEKAEQPTPPGTTFALVLAVRAWDR